MGLNAASQHYVCRNTNDMIANPIGVTYYMLL
jgi:hypothetical protein